MLNLRVDQAKTFFFDRPTVESLDRQAAAGLRHFGGLVRKTARRGIRPAARKTEAELTRDEKKRLRIREYYAKKEGRKKPKKPLRHSKPGEYPRRGPTDLLRKFLFFVYEPQDRSVVIGPATINSPTGAPENLEKGGRVRGDRFRIEPRPYMQPSFDTYVDRLPQMLFGAR